MAPGPLPPLLVEMVELRTVKGPAPRYSMSNVPKPVLPEMVELTSNKEPTALRNIPLPLETAVLPERVHESMVRAAAPLKNMPPPSDTVALFPWIVQFCSDREPP